MTLLFADRATVECEMRDLYDCHAGAIYGYALRVLGDARAAEDLVQDVFLRAWQRAYAYRPDRGPVRAWLFGIARNLAADEARRAAARPALGRDLTQHASTGDELGQTEDRIILLEALARLGQHHRQVLVMVVVEGRSLVDSARVLDVPVGTVKSRLFYALKGLRVVAEELGLTVAP